MTMAMMMRRIAPAEFELVSVDRSVERRADAAGTDDADDGGFAEVDVEPVEGKADEAGHHLRLDGPVHLLPPRSAGGTDRLHLPRVDILDVLGEQLGEEADRGERERQEAGERAEAEHGHE